MNSELVDLCGTDDGHRRTFISGPSLNQVSMLFLALSDAASSDENQHALTKWQHSCRRRVLHTCRSIGGGMLATELCWTTESANHWKTPFIVFFSFLCRLGLFGIILDYTCATEIMLWIIFRGKVMVFI